MADGGRITIQRPETGADVVVHDASGNVLYVIEAKSSNAGSRSALQRILRARARLEDVDRHLAESRRVRDEARARQAA